MQINLDDKECMLIVISLGRLHFELTSKEYRMRDVIFNEIREAYSLVDDPEKIPSHANLFSEKIMNHRIKCKKDYAGILEDLVKRLGLNKKP